MPKRRPVFTTREIRTFHDNLAFLAATDPRLWRVVASWTALVADVMRPSLQNQPSVEALKQAFFKLGERTSEIAGELAWRVAMRSRIAKGGA